MSSFKIHIPDFKNRDHWFSKHVQNELAFLKFNTDRLAGPVADFCRMALSAIIVKVSRQESETRWVAVDNDIEPGQTVAHFLDKLNDMLPRVIDYSRQATGRSTVYLHSADRDFPLKDRTIDLIMTSPPYANSFDYYLYHKLRFFWLGFDHYPVQDAELGSRNKHCDRAEGIETYVDGMRKALAECFRVLKPSGQACFVIGDSILKGDLLNMRTIYEKMARDVGLIPADHWSYDQRKYTTAFTPGTQLIAKKTHILLFKKPS